MGRGSDFFFSEGSGDPSASCFSFGLVVWGVLQKEEEATAGLSQTPAAVKKPRRGLSTSGGDRERSSTL